MIPLTIAAVTATFKCSFRCEVFLIDPFYLLQLHNSILDGRI